MNNAPARTAHPGNVAALIQSLESPLQLIANFTFLAHQDLENPPDVEHYLCLIENEMTHKAKSWDAPEHQQPSPALSLTPD